MLDPLNEEQLQSLVDTITSQAKTIENLKAENARLQKALDILTGGRAWAGNVMDAQMIGFTKENNRLRKALGKISNASYEKYAQGIAKAALA